MEKTADLIIMFFAYSLLGWCMEVILKYRQFRRFIKRGFLAGPVCPIYGYGAVLITLAAESFFPQGLGLITVFVLSLLICGLLEYLTSFLLEKVFDARWWDYSQKPMNLNGRVWIGNLALFGLGGVAIIHMIDPLLYRFLAPVPPGAKETAAGILVAVFIADNIISIFLLKLIRPGITGREADYTEEIRREVGQMLSDRSRFRKSLRGAHQQEIRGTDTGDPEQSEKDPHGP
jgi:uncharacterized membrane protein